jgi:hypothetical protein
MEQYRQLSRHGHYRSLLGVFSSSFRKLSSPSPQITVFLDQAEIDRDKSLPLLDQFKANPSRTKARAILVTTWLNASLLAKDLGDHGLPENRIVSSTTLLQVPVEHRSDGWHNPCCILSGDGKIAVISGGDRGALQCDVLAETARKLAMSAPAPKLGRLPEGILFTVQVIPPRKDRDAVSVPAFR